MDQKEIEPAIPHRHLIGMWYNFSQAYRLAFVKRTVCENLAAQGVSELDRLRGAQHTLFGAKVTV